MLTRKIPSTGEAIPVVGLGTYQGLMTRDMTEQTLAPLAEVLKRFFDAGGRLVDTAPSYGNAEEVAALRSRRLGINDTLFFATEGFGQGGEASGIASFPRSLQRAKR